MLTQASEYANGLSSPSELSLALMPHIVLGMLAIRYAHVLVVMEVSKVENVLCLPFTFLGLAATLKLYGQELSVSKTSVFPTLLT